MLRQTLYRSLGDEYIMLRQTLYRSLGDEYIMFQSARKAERSLQQDWSKESQVQDCWSGQGGVEKEEEDPFSQLRMSKYRPLLEGQHCSKVSCHRGRSISIRPCGYMKTCRRKLIDASETSHVSFDRLDDPWPS